MSPIAQGAFAAFTFLEDHVERDQGGAIDLAGLPGPGQAARRRSFIYKALADNGYRIPRLDPKKDTSLEVKLFKMSGVTGLGHHFVKQAGQVAHLLTPAVWNTQLRLNYNALPFDRRRFNAKMDPITRPSPLTSSPFPCFFCGAGEDCAPHVFGPCVVVRAARDQLGALVGSRLGHEWSTTLLAFPPVSNKAVAVSIACFNWAVWTERSQYLPTLSHVPAAAAVVSRILSRTKLRLPVDKQPTGSKGEAAVAVLARTTPPDSFIAFTDGSAIPNPGPCGAGLVVRFPGKEAYEQTSIPLGRGDNNKGEMGAIKAVGEILEAALVSGRIGKGARVLVFSDTALCLGFLVQGWTFSTWTVLAHETRAIFRRLGRRLRVTFYWIRGHAGIPGNEKADKAAKQAAREASAALGLDQAGDLRPP
jgi:ribonuclease HI